MQTRRTILRLIAISAFSIAALGSVATAQMDKYVAGRDYLELAVNAKVEPNSEKSGEVVEFFSYGCPHCNSFEPIVQKWEKTMPADVNFIRSPVSFGRQAWALLSYAKHIASKLGVEEKMHHEMFKAVHEAKLQIQDLDSIKSVFTSAGVAPEDFDAAAKSIQVKADFQKSEKNAINYKISGVPAIVVNGKYLVSSSNVKSYEEIFKVVDFLLSKDNVDLKPKA
jgi:thiol:disulfide interchange protein DsbA